MHTDEVLEEFRAAKALLEGHFILSSGLHSPTFLQCAKIMAQPPRAAKLCAALATKVRNAIDTEIDIVVSPAMGGVVVGYEMGRQLGCNAIFTERVDGRFMFRRGFELTDGQRVLMAEDVVTTGLSSRECIETIEANGGTVVAGSCLIDRSNGTADVGVPLISLAQLDVPTYRADALPPELANVPAIKPGSRDLNAKASPAALV
ncbi:MAG: orotate phosphoribosyltransferase [Pseudomonadota bacterium]